MRWLQVQPCAHKAMKPNHIIPRNKLLCIYIMFTKILILVGVHLAKFDHLKWFACQFYGMDS